MNVCAVTNTLSVTSPPAAMPAVAAPTRELGRDFNWARAAANWRSNSAIRSAGAAERAGLRDAVEPRFGADVRGFWDRARFTGGTVP